MPDRIGLARLRSVHKPQRRYAWDDLGDETRLRWLWGRAEASEARRLKARPDENSPLGYARILRARAKRARRMQRNRDALVLW